MAKYPSMVITKEGLSMIAESQGGQGLIFTKVTLGAGDLNGGSIINLTDLIDNRINANITAIDATSRPGQVTLTAVVSNSEVDAGFHAKEIGVFAKIGEGGTERLYAYTNAGNYADYMPDKTDPVNEAIFKTTFVVSNAQNIQAVIDKSIVYPTVLEMDTAIKKHNEAEDAHETVFNCYVKSVTEKNGTVTVTKGDGSSTTFNSFKLDMCYPVGSIYMSTVATSPADLFGGTWEAMPAGRVLLAQGTSEWGVEYKAGSIGGEHEHQLSVGELPSHSHAIAASTVNLTGSAGFFVGADSPSYSGILTVTKGSKGLTGGGGGHTQDYLNIQANITPSVNISAVGSNQSHENMPPFISIFCWKRIA